MAKKLLLFLFLFSYIFSAFSQEKKVLISGKVIDSISVIKNVNILNLKTSQGTSSNDNGEFKILVTLGDSIQLSSIQHIPKIIIISKYNIEKQMITITLKSNTFQLDEFELKRHNLTGSLSIDLKNKPTNRRDSLLRNTMDFSKIDMDKGMGEDHISRKVKPHKVETDPTRKFGGVGTKIPIPITDHEAILRRKLAQKKAVPNKILLELGKQFFFEELKIPEGKYFHFLEYCNPLGIENLHKENKILELIKILKEESVPYLKIIEE